MRTQTSFSSTALPPGEPVGDGSEYLLDVCPRCQKEKHFYYNLEKRKGECKVCGYKVGPSQSLGETDGLFCRPSIVNLGSYKAPGKSINAWFVEDARRFLVEKGTDRAQCFRLPIRVEIDPDTNLRRLTCPVEALSPEFPPTSLVRYYTCPRNKWYARPGVNKMHYVFGKDALERRKVLVMEGISDILATKMEGYAVALLGTAVTLEMMTALAGHELYIWFDWDQDRTESGGAGMAGTLKLLSQAENWGLTAHDLTSRIKTDPKKLTPNLGEAERRFIEGLKRELDRNDDS